MLINSSQSSFAITLCETQLSASDRSFWSALDLNWGSPVGKRLECNYFSVFYFNSARNPEWIMFHSKTAPKAFYLTWLLERFHCLYWSYPCLSEEAKLLHALQHISRRNFLPTTKLFSKRDNWISLLNWLAIFILQIFFSKVKS